MFYRHIATRKADVIIPLRWHRSFSIRPQQRKQSHKVDESGVKIDKILIIYDAEINW